MTLTAERLRELLTYDPETGEFRWRAGPRAGLVAGCRDDGNGYSFIKFADVNHRGHRLAWLYVTGEFPAGQIDHINLNRSDNRWSNLRIATSSENAHNRRAYKNNKSGYKGVSWARARGAWLAQIRLNNRRYFIGHFDDPRDAAAAYAAAAKRLHGDFARLG